jgi:hypothetical protein
MQNRAFGQSTISYRQRGQNLTRPRLVARALGLASTSQAKYFPRPLAQKCFTFHFAETLVQLQLFWPMTSTSSSRPAQQFSETSTQGLSVLLP